MKWLGVLAALTSGAFVSLANIVLNEISYHPPGERDDLQFVELYNSGEMPVDISGWKFSAGMDFAFPQGTRLASQGFLVVAKDPAALAAQYRGITALGPFSGSLKHGGARVTLKDAAGKAVDSVKYNDKAPWPISADGSGPTLERMSYEGRSEDPANWAPSTLPEREVPAGTPGQPNSQRQPQVPPTVVELSADPWRPGVPVLIRARVEDAVGIESVRVQWSLVTPGKGPGREQSTAAKTGDGSVTTARYEAALPALPAGHFLRYRLSVKSRSGAVRTYPDPNELRPFQTVGAITNSGAGTIPQFFLQTFGAPAETGGFRFNPWARNGGTPVPDPTRGNGLIVVMPTNGGPAELIDYVRIVPRSGGWKVHLPPDRVWNGVRALNVIFESKSRWVLAEHLGYEMFRRAGVPAPASGHVRVTLDGRPMGYHLWVEQPNRTFLRRHERDPNGELFKAVWYGQSVADRHEKKTQRATGHRDFLKTLRDLERLRGDEQWKYIEANFDVPETVNYYATCLLIQNWDGFFNNHYLHHSPALKQKWQVYPWDLDKTWGEYDGASARYDWYTMPLTYGMNGDRPPSDGPGSEMSGPWGGSAWWRPAGVISGPLLAHPEYRRRMLLRLRELLDTEFTLERMGPVIQDLESRLLPEVRYRLELRGNDPAAGERRFRADIDSFRRQLKGRAEYLRRQLK